MNTCCDLHGIGVKLRRAFNKEVGKGALLQVQQMTSAFSKDSLESDRRQDARHALTLAAMDKHTAAVSEVCLSSTLSSQQSREWHLLIAVSAYPLRRLVRT